MKKMDHVSCNHNQNNDSEDTFNIVCGDLGLGDGLKPGGLTTFLHLDGMKDCSPCQCQKIISKTNNTERRCSEVADSFKSKQSAGKLKSIIGKSKSLSSANESDNTERCEESFPTYADVPLGTSLRQQKKIYEQNLDSLLKKHGCKTPAGSNGNNGNHDKMGNDCKFMVL